MPAEPPGAVLSAARRFGISPAAVSPLNGNTGRTWAAGPHVIRLSTPARLDVEIAAMAAAAAAVPVPEVLDRADLENGAGALLLARLPGRPAADLSGIDDLRRVRERGRACGRLHAALAAVTAPPAVPDAADRPGPADRRLLHLDLHVLNVLVGDDDRVTGVLDWANTRAGDPALDRTRTWTILRLDPAVRAARGDRALAALVDGWCEEAGLDALPAQQPDAVGWACRFMLRDLAHRYRAEELAHVARFVRRAP